MTSCSLVRGALQGSQGEGSPPWGVEEGFKGAGEVLSKSSQRLSTGWGSRDKHLQLVLCLPPRRHWVTADSGAASSRRNGKGVTFPECHGIAAGTSCLLSRVRRAIAAACSEKPEPIGMCWMCSEQATQPRPWVSSCMETCPSSEFQHWVPGEDRHRAAQHGVVVGM